MQERAVPTHREHVEPIRPPDYSMRRSRDLAIEWPPQTPGCLAISLKAVELLIQSNPKDAQLLRSPGDGLDGRDKVAA